MVFISPVISLPSPQNTVVDKLKKEASAAFELGGGARAPGKVKILARSPA